jgi:hypothetical protein
MDNQADKQPNPIPFKDRKKEYMKEYMKPYMKAYYKTKKVTCECGSVLFPHAVKAHKETLKHKYLMTINEGS